MSESIPAHIEIRTQATREHATRSRAAFLASTLICLAILVSVYNAYFSWHRDFATLLTFVKDSDVTGKAQNEALTNWVRSQWVTIGPLGIQVGVADMAIVGSVALLISSIWLYYAIRRENHAIGDLLADSLKEPSLVQQYVYHGIASGLVFASLSDDDEPLDKDDLRIEKGEKRITKRTAKPIRQITRALVFMPPVTVFVTVAADLLSIFAIPAAFRFPHESLWARLSITGWLCALAMESLAFCAGLFLWKMAIAITRFEEATIGMMRSFNEKFEDISNLATGEKSVSFLDWLTSFK